MLKTRKNNNGITLIALVVTIVILMTLTGVTINTVIGQSGIIAKAEQAKEETLNAQIYQEEQMNVLIDKIEKVQNETDGEEENGPMPQVAVNETAKENSTINGEEGSYSNPIIPKGFKAINTTNAIWTEENGYQNGLVIEDDTKDATTQGSQFVWIPVQDYDNAFHLIDGYVLSMLQESLIGTNPTREAGASKTEKIPQNPNKGKNALYGTDESVAMYESVKTNGGFYIARYESGINGTTASTNTNDVNKQTQDGTVKPVSKAKVGVWNYISWGGTTEKEASDGEAGNDTADGAVKVARSMYNNPISGSSNTATTVKSTLCYGVQWDAVMTFIDSNYVSGNATEDYIVRYGADKGNYTGTIAVTGDKETYAQKNIYDLAGNVYEWTMEVYSTNQRHIRGGAYDSDGSFGPASSRYVRQPSDADSVSGFRVALYL